jgi:hypothetical protein
MSEICTWPLCMMGDSERWAVLLRMQKFDRHATSVVSACWTRLSENINRLISNVHVALLISHQPSGEGETRNCQGHLVSKTSQIHLVQYWSCFLLYSSLIIFIEQWRSCSAKSRKYLEVVCYSGIKRIINIFFRPAKNSEQMSRVVLTKQVVCLIPNSIFRAYFKPLSTIVTKAP